jgi:copper(I)-binding protein
MNRIAVATTILLSMLVLAGCGSAQAGTRAPGQAGNELDGVDGQVGGLRLLSVAISAPGAPGSLHLAGDSAALLFTIANDGKTQDVLIGAGADVAGQIAFRNGDDAPDPQVQVPVPPGESAALSAVTGPHLELSGLRRTLGTGSDVAVTFAFRDAGSVTLMVPVATYTDVRPDKYLPGAATTH